MQITRKFLPRFQKPRPEVPDHTIVRTGIRQRAKRREVIIYGVLEGAVMLPEHTGFGIPQRSIFEDPLSIRDLNLGNTALVDAVHE